MYIQTIKKYLKENIMPFFTSDWIFTPMDFSSNWMAVLFDRDRFFYYLQKTTRLMHSEFWRLLDKRYVGVDFSGHDMRVDRLHSDATTHT